MTRARRTPPKARRSREVLAVVGAIALAAGSGLLAAHFGTHRPWESIPASRAPASTSTSSTDPQRNP